MKINTDWEYFAHVGKCIDQNIFDAQSISTKRKLKTARNYLTVTGSNITYSQ